jgi:hypothetical protein
MAEPVAGPRLERWYRWLLRWYPRAHRDEYEDEMVGVLLADSTPGRRWPSAAVAADLVAGGVMAWLRRGVRPVAAGPWRDAAAVVGLLVPVVLLVHLVPGLLVLARTWSWHGWAYQLEFGAQVGAALPWAAVLVAVLAGWSRVTAWLAAGAAAVQLAVWAALSFQGWQLGLAGELLGVVGALALAGRPPARHGIRLLGRGRTVVVALLVPVLLVTAEPWGYGFALGGEYPEGHAWAVVDFLERPVTAGMTAHTVLAAVAGALLLALVVRRVGLAVGTRVITLAVPAVAVWLGLPPLGGPFGALSRLVEAAVLGAVAFGLASAAGAVLARLVRGRPERPADRV